MKHYRAECDYEDEVVRIYELVVEEGFVGPLQEVAVLKSEDEGRTYFPKLREEDQDRVAWFWHDMAKRHKGDEKKT